MKIFVEDIKLNEIDMIKLINHSEIVYTKTGYVNLFSLEGIYKVNHGENNLSLCRYIDGNTKTIKLNNYKLLIDTSRIEYLNDISQIPYDCLRKSFTEHNFKLSKRSILSLVIIYGSDTISDFYFEYKTTDDKLDENIDDKIKNIMFKEDFIKFLSLIR